MTLDAEKKRLVELLEPLAAKEWLTDSILNNVRFIRTSRHFPRHPLVYEPGILIIAQGQKIVYFRDKIYKYNANNYLVRTMPLFMELETIASPEEPLLEVGIKIDPVMISELLIEMDSITPLPGSMPRGLYSSRITKVILDAVIRLLECLSDPVDGRVLGPQIVREIVYRVLCGEQGEALRLLATSHGRFSQMAKVLNRIHMSFNTKLDIETLAEEAKMSVSSLHSNFKAVTNTSPIQYIKEIRLQKARMFMIQDGLNAVDAAVKVGYESASQFSREFKRYFGRTPLDEAVRMRNFVGAPFLSEAAT
jgi:AraC-like DNA-binding protein